jgi:hypothetical protein
MPVEPEWSPDDVEDHLREKFGGGTYELRPLGEDGLRLCAGGKAVSKCVQVPGFPKPFAPDTNAAQGLGFFPAPAYPSAPALAPALSPTPPDRMDRVERALEGLSAAVTALASKPAPSGFDSILQGVKAMKALQELNGAPAAAPGSALGVADIHAALNLVDRLKKAGGVKNDDDDDEDDGGGGEGEIVKELFGFAKDWLKNRSVEAARTPAGGMAFRSVPQANLSGQAGEEEPDEMEALLDALLEALKSGKSAAEFGAEVKPKLSRLTRIALKAVNPADAAELLEEKYPLEDDERNLLQSPQGQEFLEELKKYL